MSKNVESQYTEVSAKEEEEIADKPTPYGYGVRHVQIFLAFLSFSIAYEARAHIGITVVAMTKPTSPLNKTDIVLENITQYIDNSTIWEDVDYMSFSKDNDNGTWDIPDYFEEEAKNVSKRQSNPPVVEILAEKSYFETYDWSKSTQEMVMGAFLPGYSMMIFPVGMLCQRYGGKLPMQIALLINGLSGVLTPWLVAWGGWKAVCVCRFFDGVGQAGLYPSVQVIVARWSHPDERGKFISFVFTGGTLGTIIAFQIGGILASSWGWPSIFWVTGGLSLTMFVIMTVFGAASPAQHKNISKEEKMYITGKSDDESKKRQAVPWKAIFTSRHMWATVTTHVGSALGYFFFFNQVPSYLHYVLNMDVKKSGILSSLPYLASFFANIGCGFLSDYITTRKILSVANARRVSNSFAQIGIALCFVAVSFTKNVELAVACLVLCMSFQSAIHTGLMINYIDLSPRYSSTLTAIGSAITCSTVSIAPFINSAVITDVTNQAQWRVMFMGLAALMFVTNAVFVVFMTSDTQPWNDYGYKEADTEDKQIKEDIAANHKNGC